MMKKVYRKKLGAKAKAAKAKIASKSGGDQFKNLKDWLTFFGENERLPSQKITCSNCKKKQTSMFGDNLKRNLIKFGSIEKLLTKFECVDCRKTNAPVRTVKVKSPKHVNTEVESITVKGNSAKEYLTVDEIEDRKEKVRATLPKFDPDSKPTKIDFKDPVAVADLTNGSCQRPDIYLDAGCKYCPMSEYCACLSKDMKRDILNEGRFSRKRK